jgi:crossover junction endodeoxyribonuclease RusA
MPTLDLPLGPALSVNAVYGTHNRFRRAQIVKVWREAAAWQVRADQWPPMRQVKVEVWPVKVNRQGTPDVGSCFPSYKAMLDGIVDAGVLDDDGPEIVVEVTFRPALLLGWNGVRLKMTEVGDGPVPMP